MRVAFIPNGCVMEFSCGWQAMEVDEKPTEDYSDIGGLDKQIQELVEAIVLPVTHKDRFQSLGIRPPKGVLLYGPPGTGELHLPAFDTPGDMIWRQACVRQESMFGA